MRLVCIRAETIAVMMVTLGLRRQPMQAFTKQRNADEDSQQEAAQKSPIL
jgi:hypothetical protein